MNIEKDLQEVISKNLPQAIGELLQRRLVQADRDAARVSEFGAIISANDKRISSLTNEVTELMNKLDEHAAIDQREAAVSAREIAAEIEALKVQLAAAQTNTQFAKDVAMGLVRNSEYRNTVFTTDNTTTPLMREGYQIGSSTSNANSTVSETKSVT